MTGQQAAMDLGDVARYNPAWGTYRVVEPQWSASAPQIPADPFSKLKLLRPFQVEAIARLKAVLVSGKRKVILKAPTGAGKTVIASHIVQSALDKGKRVIFAVDSIDLVEQTASKFFAEGITEIGVMQANHVMTDPNQTVQVCSIQTLERRSIPDSDLVLIDEAHSARKFVFRWMEKWNTVPFIGLTATPYTRGLGKFWDALVIACTTRELIDQGLLSPFRVFAPSHPDLRGVKMVAGDYHEGQLSKAMMKGSLVADVVDTWCKLAEGRSTLCYGVDRAHARKLQEEYLKAGVPCGYQDAYTDLEERREIAAKFRRGEYKVVANVGTLTKGIDWDVRCIQLVRPTTSEILFQQIVGRALRTADGKDFALILDHSDTTLRLGYVTDIDDAFTELSTGKENGSAAKKKKVQVPRECQACHFLKPAGVGKCPACGFIAQRQSEIENKEGDLVEIDMQKKEKRKRNRVLSPQEKRVFFGELKYYAMQKGYKPGWAANKYRSYCGVWPNAHADAPMVEPGYETLGWIRHEQIKWAKGKQNEAAKLPQHA